MKGAAIAGAVALAIGFDATSAVAIPWDRGGAMPAWQTPSPSTPDPYCAESYANEDPRVGPPIRFGIGPLLAGESGTAETVPVVPDDRRKRDRGLQRLKGGGYFAVRLNRMFMSDGRAGIRRFRRLARRFASRGLEVELQVRYHPAPEDEGEIRKWLRFVKRVVRAFGPNGRVTGLQITNEVNIPFSPNTSDGAFDRAVEALVRGVIAAKRESRRRGFTHQRIGFNYAWRFDFLDPASDARFWEAIGRMGGRKLRRHTDWVGLDAYPGTWVPGVLVPATIVDLGDAFLEAIAQTRECFMPKAGFGKRTPLRVEETGYPTGPGRPERDQEAAVRSLVRAAHEYRGAYNVTDFRWFNLRDNNSRGPNFQQHYGLMRDDYSRKPAFDLYRRLVARHGARRRRASAR